MTIAYCGSPIRIIRQFQLSKGVLCSVISVRLSGLAQKHLYDLSILLLRGFLIVLGCGRIRERIGLIASNVSLSLALI